jgi:hypothetical protein
MKAIGLNSSPRGKDSNTPAGENHISGNYTKENFAHERGRYGRMRRMK